MYRIPSVLLVAILTVMGCKEYPATETSRVDSLHLDADAYNIIEQQDRQLRTTVLLTLIPVIVAFSFIVFVFYRARRESFFKQQETEFRLGISELEMKALRAQINPHFIFNCLNSIHHYMHQHDVKLAGDYLIKFSQLIRHVLETSSSRMIPLTDDIEALKLYLELEQLRMQRSFEFQIVTEAIADPHLVHIPPMMMQPFVENSIWHGLNNTGPGGFIKIDIHITDGMVQCIIEDNGKRNIKKNDVLISAAIKKTSMGMSLINDRLAAVSRIYKTKATFIMEDRLNDAAPKEGTRIILMLPFEN